MSWARLDDGFWAHEKVLMAGNTATGVYVRALCYCAQQHTDGFVNDLVARIIAPKKCWDELVRVKLIKRVEAGETFEITRRRDSGRRPLPDVTLQIAEDGYLIPDFLHFNSTKEEADDRRHKRQDAARASNSANAHAPESANAHAPAQQLRSLPVPAPPSRSKSSYAMPSQAVDNLLKSVTDADALTRVTVEKLCRRFRLAEGDLAWAKECAQGPGVSSPAAVAVAELKKRGEAKQPKGEAVA